MSGVERYVRGFLNNTPINVAEPLLNVTNGSIRQKAKVCTPAQQAAFNILNLALPVRGQSDESVQYKRKSLLPRSILLGKALGGRPRRSSQAFSCLPEEILDDILQYIPQEDLASLSQVNHDCRLLARTRQFATIKLKYNQHSWDLLNHLVAESWERFESTASLTVQPALGACIRRIIVETDAEEILDRYDLGTEWGTFFRDMGSGKITAANSDYYDNYVRQISCFLMDADTLPNLESFEWRDRAPPSLSMIRSLPFASAKNLKLVLSSQYSSDKPCYVSEYPLLDVVKNTTVQTLYLGFEQRWIIPQECSLFFDALYTIRVCGPTLESLTWDFSCLNTTRCRCMRDRMRDIGGPPVYPKLRTLKIKNLNCPRLSIIREFFYEGLQRLDVDEASGELQLGFLRPRTIRSLRTVIWKGAVARALMKFLRDNSHIERLYIAQPPSPLDKTHSFLSKAINSSLSNLTSLSLFSVTGREHSNEKDLKLIGSITTLEQLQLTSSVYSRLQRIWDTWVPNHNLIRSLLSGLTRLKKLSYTHDEHDTKGNSHKISESTSSTSLTLHDFLGTSDKRTSNYQHPHLNDTDNIHRWTMLVETAQYAVVFPQLDWMYMGGWPIGIGESEEVGKRRVYVLSDEVDKCEDYRTKLFEGLERDPFAS